MSSIKDQIITLVKQRQHSHKVALEQEKDPRSKHAIDLIARIREDSRLIEVMTSLPDESENHGCGVEFPHFGANYPDAKCIDGYLWDMDSYEDGIYTIGGDDPCPICNTEKWLKDVLDDGIFKTRDEALEYVKMLKSKYKHKDSLPEEEPSKDLEEEIQNTIDKYPLNKEDMSEDDIATYHQGLIFGARHFAEWQKKQMMKEVKFGVVCKNGERDEEDVWIELNPGSLPDYKDTDPIDFIIVKQ